MASDKTDKYKDIVIEKIMSRDSAKSTAGGVLTTLLRRLIRNFIYKDFSLLDYLPVFLSRYHKRANIKEDKSKLSKKKSINAMKKAKIAFSTMKSHLASDEITFKTFLLIIKDFFEFDYIKITVEVRKFGKTGKAEVEMHFKENEVKMPNKGEKNEQRNG